MPSYRFPRPCRLLPGRIRIADGRVITLGVKYRGPLMVAENVEAAVITGGRHVLPEERPEGIVRRFTSE